MLTQPTYSLVVVVTEPPDFLAGRWAGRAEYTNQQQAWGIVSSRETFQGKVAVVVSGQSPLSVPIVSLCTVVATYGMFVLWDLIDDVYRLPGCPSPAAWSLYRSLCRCGLCC